MRPFAKTLPGAAPPGGRTPRAAVRLVFGALLLGAPAPTLAAADLALVNGRFFTLAPNVRSASAVLIRDGKIAVVAGDAEVLKAAPAGTKVINLHGYVGYPAFQDAHSRLGECGPAAVEVSLAKAADVAALKAALRDSLPAAARGAWLVGADWDPLAVRGTRRMLDSLSAGIPIWLRSADGHVAWLSTRALAALGIGLDAADPEGGWFERDADGKLTGICWEAASFLATERWVNSAGVEQAARAIERRIAEAAKLGVVTFHDASPYERSAEAFALLARKRQLKARVIEMPMPQLPRGYDAWTRLKPPDDGRLTLGPTLLVVDGSPLAGTAAVSGGDAGRADSGRFLIPPARLDSLVAAAARAGRGVALEASGDRAVRAALEAMERAGGGGSLPGPLRIERAARVGADAPARAKRLGVVWVPQPRDLPDAGDTLARASKPPAGAARPYATPFRGGGQFAFGSGASPQAISPYQMILRVLSHPTESERPPSTACLNAVTLTAAKAGGEGDASGNLVVGKRGDIVVLDRDLLRVPPESLPYTRVLVTVSAGEVVHRTEL